MNMSFYTAAVGAAQQQNRIHVQANNIANVNTNGYKAERPSFSTLMYGGIDGIGGERLPRGTGARMIMAGIDFSDGAAQDTGRTQDYAIAGNGFFALQNPQSGEISYTRDGSFALAATLRDNGLGEEEPVFLLADGLGNFVLDENLQPIVAEDPNAKYPVGVFDFVSRDGMQNLSANRFLPVAKNGPALPVESTVLQGFLESSNTDLANELTKVIEAQRSFTYTLKMIQTSDEVETTINGLSG